MKNTQRFISIFLITLCFLTSETKAFDGSGTITSGGKSRSFIFHAPGSFVTSNLPVLFVFHGDNSNGESIKNSTGFNAIADANNFLAIYPNADNEGWNRAIDQSKDTQFTSDMIDYFCGTYHINTKRIYATGVSAGGYMTYNLAVNLPGKIAAFAPISGNMYSTTGTSTYFASPAFKPVAICHIHGSLDTNVPYPDPDNQPTPWQEWPLTQFSYYTCGKTTYTLPTTPITTGVSKLVFCAGNAPDVKELSLISVAGKVHESLIVPGFNPYQAAWDFVKAYSITGAQSCADAVSEVIHANGRQILSSCDKPFIPRGVNYSLADDWEFPSNINGDPTHVNDELSAQIIKAKPNTVRIEWYANRAAGWKPYSIADLDVVITRFKAAGIVSIIDLHDVTCSNDYALFNSLVLPWWKQQQVKDLLNKHKGFVIANLANEFGKVKWSETANEATAYTIWLNHYKNAISELRTAGIQVPLMIDGPDCGQNLDAVLQAGNPLNQHDPSHNIIMSAHAYWYQDDAAKMIARTTQIEAATFPIVLGEIANKQDNTIPCEFSISSYTNLLTSCQEKGIGWLAWTWTDDWCSDRRISPTGSFSALSDYGNTIVNSPVFGLSTYAEKLNVACLSNPLPVTLLSFGASRTDDKNVLLKWNTAQETNFKEFVLERGPDTRRFEAISIVLPAESSTYEYLDKDAIADDNYYRLKMVDNDGSYSYSRIVLVKGPLSRAVVLYPSPTSDYIRIDAEDKLFPLKVSVISATGKTVVFQVLKSKAEKISMERLPAGIYTVTTDAQLIGKIVIDKK